MNTVDIPNPMPEEEYDTIHVDIDQLHQAIKQMEALQALEKDPNFQLLITDGFLSSEPLRVTAALASPVAIGYDPRQPHATRADKLAVYTDQLMGISVFNQYLFRITSQGQEAKSMLKEADELAQQDTDNDNADTDAFIDAV